MNRDLKNILLTQIKYALEDRTISVVSKKTGIHRATIAKAKAGEPNIHIGTIFALCDYLNIDMPA